MPPKRKLVRKRVVRRGAIANTNSVTVNVHTPARRRAPARKKAPVKTHVDTSNTASSLLSLGRELRDSQVQQNQMLINRMAELNNIKDLAESAVNKIESQPPTVEQMVRSKPTRGFSLFGSRTKVKDESMPKDETNYSVDFGSEKKEEESGGGLFNLLSRSAKKKPPPTTPQNPAVSTQGQGIGGSWTPAVTTRQKEAEYRDIKWRDYENEINAMVAANDLGGLREFAKKYRGKTQPHNVSLTTLQTSLLKQDNNVAFDNYFREFKTAQQDLFNAQSK